VQTGVFELKEIPEDMHEFVLEIEEKHQDIEKSLLALENDPSSKEWLNELVRALHTIKGDARILNFEPMVLFTHAIENIVDFIREGSFSFNAELSEIILQGSDRLLTMAKEVMQSGKTRIGDLYPIKQEMELLVLNGPAMLDKSAARVIAMYKGQSPRKKDSVANQSGVFVLTEHFEDITDFMEEVSEKHRAIEDALMALEVDPKNAELLNEVFRALHTIKGDARIFGIGPMTDFTHAVENIVQGLREGSFLYTNELSEVILLCVDRMKLITHDVGTTHRSDLSDMPQIIETLNDLFQQGQAGLSETIPRVTAALSGKKVEPRIETHIETSVQAATTVTLPSTKDYYGDLDFFRQLSNQVDESIPQWEGRTSAIGAMAIGMNGIAGNPVNYFQLEAAVYLHDIGMGFLPPSLMTKKEKLTDDEFARLKEHTLIGAGIAERMQGWGQAAEIVLQHHEHHDGRGYPNHLEGDEIVPGAQLMAICDAFYAMTHSLPYKINKRSIVRAVAEINACSGTQFSPFWVTVFNKVIKIQYLNGSFRHLD
jgi:HPt (histidine-containing phosphotransfer) domain-containing protein